MKRVLLLLLLFILTGPANAEVEEAVGKLRTALTNLNSYELECEFARQMLPADENSPEIGTTKSSLKVMDRKFLDLETQTQVKDKTLWARMVFDGEWQWVEQRLLSGKNLDKRVIIKVDSSISPTNQPFKTGYQYDGTGLDPGLDYRETFLHYLELHKFHSLTKEQGKWELLGELNLELVKKRMEDRGEGGFFNMLYPPEQGVPQFTVQVDPKTWLPLGFHYRDARNDSKFVVTNLRVDPVFAAEDFAYTPPPLWPVFNQTKLARKALAQEMRSLPAATPQVDPMSQEMSDLLDDKKYDSVLGLVLEDPKLVNTLDIVGMGALHYFTDDGSPAQIEKLLKAGADPDIPGPGNNYPLHIAIERFDEKKVEVVELLLRYKANPNVRDSNGGSPLHRSKSSEFDELLENAGGNPELLDVFGKSALDLRAQRPPEIKTDERHIRFADAILEGRTAEIRELLADGLSPVDTMSIPAPGYDDMFINAAPLAFALEKNQVESARVLLEQIEKQGLMEENRENLSWTAANAGSKAMFDVLSVAVTDLTIEGYAGGSLLHEAQTTFGFLGLLEMGVDPSVLNDDDSTALLKFFEQNRYSSNELTKTWPSFLSQARALGADLDQPLQVANNSELTDYTLLHWAVLIDKQELVRALCAAGASTNAKTKLGWTPVHLAATASDMESLDILASAGASLDAKAEYDWTPLHSALFLGQYKSVEKLLQLGADPTIKNEQGMTPLDMAKELKKENFIELLDR